MAGFDGIKKAAGQIIEATSSLTSGTLKIVGNIIGITFKKKKILIEEFSEYNENFL